MRIQRVIGVIFLVGCLDLGSDGKGCGDWSGPDLAMRPCPGSPEGQSCTPGDECAFDSHVTCRCTGIWRCDGLDLSLPVDLSREDF
jgi:hypothetical protein